MPTAAVSDDMSHWAAVVDALYRGGNPYIRTTHLNWPPLWMQILYLLFKIAITVRAPFFRVVQAFLIAVDLAGIIVAGLILERLSDSPAARRAQLLVLALNPVSIFLTCQHCNFDALVVLWMLLSSLFLLEFHRRGEPVDWLLGLLFLGLGVLTKTIPLILLPLFFCGWKRLSLKTAFLGLCLFAGPAALGLSVLYVLGPDSIVANVLSYRSYSGWFGFTRLLGSWSHLYRSAAPLVLLAAGALGLRYVLRQDVLKPRQQILLSALLLAAIPILGPGYGPEYAAWPLPFLVCAYAGYPDRTWRAVLIGLLVTAGATCLVEYALFSSHGAFLIQMAPSPALEDLSRRLSQPAAQAQVRLPLFLVSLAMLAKGAALLRGDAGRAPAKLLFSSVEGR